MTNRVGQTPTLCGIAICLVCLSPAFAIAAAPLGTAISPSIPSLVDIALGDSGLLEGQVSDTSGTPLSDRSVVLFHHGIEIARTTTNGQGRFTISGVRGGTHRLVSGENSRFVRTWTKEAAPPAAKSAAALIVGPAVRGQIGGFHLPVIPSGLPSIHPVQYLNSPLTIGGLIGAAVAVPVAIHRPVPDRFATPFGRFRVLNSPPVSYVPH
jgi:hypothetical protein